MNAPSDSLTPFAEAVLPWFDQFGRKHLPWQQNRNAYRVWVSEIMLQQTQVSTVIPYFERFMARFPDVASLAAGEQAEVLQLWTGLGYYARGRNLHKCARQIMEDFDGKFPQTVEALEQLPGIGRSTAGAIISLAYQQQATILDGNVKRVLARYHGVAGWPGQSKVAATLWEHAESHTPKIRARDYTQAMMDLGATLCTRSKPQCTDCPLNHNCFAFQQDRPENFPGKKPKKPLPVKSTQLLIVLDHKNRVLLEQRPPSGIWGGLWSFPELERETDPQHWCKTQFGISTEQKKWPPFRHTFSHYHLDIQPVLIQLTKKMALKGVQEKNHTVWLKGDEWRQLGLPAPIKKLLLQLTDLITS